jgi:hypothetical protein
MINYNFAAFILTNGRADHVVTYTSLKRKGYTGRIFLIVDDMDEDKNKYIENYGDEVFIFNKKKTALHCDSGNNSDNLKGILFARNACFDIAEILGLDYFIELDDDYTAFSWRWNSKLEYCHQKMNNCLDDVFNALLKFYINSNCTSIAMTQGGDFIGGSENTIWADKVKLRRKAMNSFICSPSRRFDFMGFYNDDVNTYTKYGSIGKLFFTTNHISLNQIATQINKGGMSDTYISSGTYVKSFYSVMWMPSAVKINMIGTKSRRIHHRIKWEYCVPKILDEKYRKG